MAKTVCPYCEFDRRAGVIAKGASTGAVIGTITVINPVAGAVAAIGVGVWKLWNLGEKEVVCPQCGTTYAT